MSEREKFRQLLARREEVRQESIGLSDSWRSEMAKTIKAYTGWKEDDIALRIKASRKLQPWEVAELRRPIDAATEARDRELRAEAHWLDTQLGRLARQLRARPGASWLPYERRTLQAYASQTGARSYAEVSARLIAAEIEAHGVEARIDQVVDPNGYAVMVAVEEPLDVQILRRSPAKLSFRDQIKFVLSRGLNIRVMFPGLPWGIEERLGLDHFGRDLPSQAAV